MKTRQQHMRNAKSRNAESRRTEQSGSGVSLDFNLGGSYPGPEQMSEENCRVIKAPVMSNDVRAEQSPAK